MTDLYVFAAVVVAMALTLLIALWLAPEGWQDREGFHVGSKIAPKLDQFSYTGHDDAGAAK